MYSSFLPHVSFKYCMMHSSNLTWRDMQHIVVMTAHTGNLHARDWKTNGVGRNVSHSFGYGKESKNPLILIVTTVYVIKNTLVMRDFQ